MGPMLKGSLYTLTAIIISQTAFKLFSYWWRRRTKIENERKSSLVRKRDEEIMEVYFFPDTDIACKAHFLGETQCFKENCKYSHGKTSLSELYRYLNCCRRTMDVCVYILTSVELTGIVLAMYKRGVIVRVITDDEQEKIKGSQVWLLRSAGVPIRTDHSSSFMHHKFVIVDGEILINGSFNWTRSSIASNQENVIITNNHKLVSAFKAEFEKLWLQFDPCALNDTCQLNQWKEKK